VRTILNDYASAGGQELWNTTRLASYFANVGSPFDSGPVICSCDTLTPAMVGDDTLTEYGTPTADPAPWYDENLDVSGEYLGFLPLSVGGLNDNPRSRKVTGSVGGGGVFGPSRDLPRTIPVQGVIIGSTCCGAEYGLQYLTEALQGCNGAACDGDCFEMFDCCPDGVQTPVQFRADHRRTFRRTALVDGPTVVRYDGTGEGCARGACSAGAMMIVVEFTLVAGTPWAWTDPIPLLDVPLPIAADTDECVAWCVRPGNVGNACDNGEPCLFANCNRQSNACGDPWNPIPIPPEPVTPATAFCVPFQPDRACYDIDLTFRPEWTSDAMMIEINAGSAPLRNVRVALYPKAADDDRTCDQVADDNRCNVVNEAVITYVPAGGSVTIDGQTGQALTQCLGECQAASTVYGNQNGGPLRTNLLCCATYCLCIESDSAFPPAEDASLSFSVSGRGY
jgi:hypothetical protein